MGSAPASEHDQLAFADLVLRLLGLECPSVDVEMVRAVDFESRILVRQPVHVPANSAFELTGPRVLTLPRTRRSLQSVVEASGAPLPGIVPFVSAASGHSVTVAAARATGCVVSAAVAERAMQLHWLAPWSRSEIESVSTSPGSPCQRTSGTPSAPDDQSHGDPVGGPGAAGRPSGLLVFAAESEAVDPERDLEGLWWHGARLGVVRSAPVPPVPTAPSGSMTPSARWSPVRVGVTEYVLVDACP
jgi:hypothetical protein